MPFEQDQPWRADIVCQLDCLHGHALEKEPNQKIETISDPTFPLNSHFIAFLWRRRGWLFNCLIKLVIKSQV